MPTNTNAKKSCCSWKCAIAVVLVLAVAGVLIYFFAPIDGVVENLPKFNRTNGGENEDGDETVNSGSTSPPTSAPTTTPLFTYQFMQCDDVNNSCCNGLEEICNLGVDEILWATSHNSMATKEGNFIFGPNHLYNLEQSLDAGYRALNLDVCNCGGDYELCHGVCTIGARSPTEVFDNIITFLNDNPSEIMLINLQVNNDAQGGSDVSLEAFSNVLTQNVAGFGDKLYMHDATQPWPTLQTLIDADDRILLFHFNGPTSCANGACPDGFHYWWDFAAETPFDFGSANEFDDAATSCAITRGAGSTKEFFAVTGFVSPPDPSVAAQVNAQAALESRIQACSEVQGSDVNLLYVDFWSVGDLPQVVQEHNKALAQRRKKERRMLR